MKHSYRGADSTQPTSHHIRSLLPKVFNQISASFQDASPLVLSVWPSLVGPHLAPMTQAVSFHEGIMTIKVKNSSLYSLLSQHERPRLLKRLQQMFPHTPIKSIRFMIG